MAEVALDLYVRYVYNVEQKGGEIKMPMTPREMVRLLEANGFHKVRSCGSHFFFKNDSTEATVLVPMHSKDLGKGLEQKILKDAGLK